MRWSTVIGTGMKLLAMAGTCYVSTVHAMGDMLDFKLTEEQYQLLYGEQQVHYPGSSSEPLPLVRFELTAETNLMKGNSLDLSANYQSWSMGPQMPGFNTTYSAEFSVKAPVQRYLDFTQSIREKAEFSAEKLFDKLIIDGAVGFNFTW